MCCFRGDIERTIKIEMINATHCCSARPMNYMRLVVIVNAVVAMTDIVMMDGCCCAMFSSHVATATFDVPEAEVSQHPPPRDNIFASSSPCAAR